MKLVFRKKSFFFKCYPSPPSTFFYYSKFFFFLSYLEIIFIFLLQVMDCVFQYTGGLRGYILLPQPHNSYVVEVEGTPGHLRVLHSRSSFSFFLSLLLFFLPLFILHLCFSILQLDMIFSLNIPRTIGL